MTKTPSILDKFRNRSFAELKVRGRQGFSSLAERLNMGGRLATDAEFARMTGAKNIADYSAEKLLENFRHDADVRFFASLENPPQTSRDFRSLFGEFAAREIIERAEKSCSGKFDLLGFDTLDFGVPVDWHLEPVSGKRSPLKHWSQFDELDASETGDPKIVWELNRHQHFFALGAAYHLTGDEKFAVAFVMHLCGWMEQNPVGRGVNWVSSLEIGLRSISWLWALQFFKFSPNLSPQIFADTLKFLHAGGRHIEKYLSTYFSPNTHLTGEALALYYLGVMLPQLDSAARWRTLGAKILLEQLEKQIFADGVYFEQSTWYQRYTVDFYTHFYILSGLNGEELLAVEHERLENRLQAALDFIMYATRPDGTTPLVGDDDGGTLFPFCGSIDDDFRPSLATGAALFNRGDYKFAARDLCEPTFWLLGAAGVEKFDRLEPHQPQETSKFFADGGYFVMRDDWTDTTNFLIADGGRHGSLGGGHAHADALAIDLTIAGRKTLVDAGTYSYHESAEIRDYFRSSAAHNTLTIDGKSSSAPAGKFAWKSIAAARAAERFHHNLFDFFQASHNGFSRLEKNSKDSITHTRSVLFVRGNYWILHDEIKAAGKHDYELNFHFAADADPKISDDGAFVFNAPTRGNADGLKMLCPAANGSWRVKEDSISDCYGRRTASKTAVFAASGTGKQDLFTFLLPTDAAHENLTVKEITANGGRGFAVHFGKWQDWLICGGDKNEWVENDIFGSNFRFAWARFEAATFDLTELFLIGGNRFVFNRSEILRLPETTPFVCARRAGGVLSFENFERELGAMLMPNIISKKEL